RLGDSAAFVSAGGYHHHIGLNTWESMGGPPPAPGTTGLYHIAIRYPDRRSLGDALRRLRGAGIPLDGASDHGVSEALYRRDHDHGPRDQGSAWSRLACAAPGDPALSHLRAELRLPRDLLEQPPPHDPRRRAGQRDDPVGQPPPALLAVAGAGRDRLVGGNE